MKKNIWIQTKIFLSFSIFIIFLVNIFLFLIYFFIEKNFKDNIYKNIINEYSTIKTFVNLQKENNFINLPNYEIEKINNLWFFFYIWNNDKKLQKNYKIWFIENPKEIIFRWDYSWYNIIIWKKINDLEKIKNIFFKTSLFLNIFLILSVLFFVYLITKFSLNPLIKLSKFLEKFDIKKDKNLLKNNYWNSEIWILTQKINNFIIEIKNLFEGQKDFIRDVSHELKTPLMQINSNLEIIENKIQDKNILEKLKNIENSTSNMNLIISNLNFILKPEEENLKLEKINLYNFLENFIKKYEELASKKNIKIKIIKNYDLTLENNSYYLERLFWNLISNAIFYNNWNNEIKIILEKNYFAIKDEWIWINKEELNKIFSRFYRNKNSNIYYDWGNWLWLSIVKKICEIFAWKIEVNSKKNFWTIFKIIIK